MKFEPPFIVFDDLNREKFCFQDPADAMEYLVRYGMACDVIDSNGTTINLKQLEVVMKQYDAQKTKPKVNKYTVDIHTDGSCKGNPGPGGYAAIIVMGKHEKTVVGYDLATTNNKMELKAVIEAVKALDKPCEITVHTDSQYLCTCSKHDKPWFENTDRPNKDLWFELITEGLVGKHHIKFVKVSGHSGEEYNERCDKLAKEQARKACHVLAGLL